MPIGPDVLLVLIVVLVIVLLWRGPKTLPGLGTAFGQAIKGARDAARDVTNGNGTEETAAPNVSTATAAPPAAPAPVAAPAPSGEPPTAPPADPSA
ncbi:MAG: twin-arginine translocase TatA/TatE family subunit [Candidatus Limnocylindrales bacterium]